MATATVMPQTGSTASSVIATGRRHLRAGLRLAPLLHDLGQDAEGDLLSAPRPMRRPAGRVEGLEEPPFVSMELAFEKPAQLLGPPRARHDTDVRGRVLQARKDRFFVPLAVGGHYDEDRGGAGVTGTAAGSVRTASASGNSPELAAGSTAVTR